MSAKATDQGRTHAEPRSTRREDKAASTPSSALSASCLEQSRKAPRANLSGWQTKPFEECIDDVAYTRKIQRRDFLSEGEYPIVSQEEGQINGYWDDEADLFKVERPVVVFGDHTRALKYVDFDFVLGADGVKILQPKQFLLPRFFFYQLQTADLSSLGYARHYRLLKALEIHYPPLPEQRRIVGILDEALAGIAAAKAHAERNRQNARALFESHLHAVFSHPGPGWVEKHLEEVSIEFGRGKSKHRPRNDPKLYGGKYPFIQTGDVRNATHVIESYSQTYSDVGLAQSKLWPAGTLCITIAANIAETGVLGFDACFPDSVIGLVADEKQTTTHFVEYLLRHFKAELQALGKGSAQDNINLGTFESRRFPFPPRAEQNQIVRQLDALAAETRRLEGLYERKAAALDELKQSLLHQAFSGGFDRLSHRAGT